jgi:hypothetical protein
MPGVTEHRFSYFPAPRFVTDSAGAFLFHPTSSDHFRHLEFWENRLTLLFHVARLEIAFPDVGNCSGRRACARRDRVSISCGLRHIQSADLAGSGPVGSFLRAEDRQHEWRARISARGSAVRVCGGREHFCAAPDIVSRDRRTHLWIGVSHLGCWFNRGVISEIEAAGY